uniref:Uncharacterized protein n=1 Tax=Zea mays TaxID=4577 RepID=A0A804QU03_MAIZE
DKTGVAGVWYHLGDQCWEAAAVETNKYWIENSHKRYIPYVEDTVLGTVILWLEPNLGVNFLVDIKGPNLPFLPVLAFEGGTRRNIPKFEIGTLIYARVVKANSIMNPGLSCRDATGKAAEFGQLKDGYMFDTSTGMSRMLLSTPTCPVLEALGKKNCRLRLLLESMVESG